MVNEKGRCREGEWSASPGRAASVLVVELCCMDTNGATINGSIVVGGKELALPFELDPQ